MDGAFAGGEACGVWVEVALSERQLEKEKLEREVAYGWKMYKLAMRVKRRMRARIGDETWAIMMVLRRAEASR